jgi:hypothetical protein
MSTIIQIKRSAVQGKVPLVGDLALGEFAINTYDGKVFIKKNVGGTESIVDVTAELTASQILTLINTVDGAGSGLDADLLDGLNSDAFAQLNSTSANADDYLQVSRNSVDPALLINQLSTGDIARFYKGTAAANTSAAAQVTITNGGGITATGTVTAPSFSGPLTGNASTATTLQNARTIAISGDVTGTATSFNGSADITISTAITADSIVNADINSSAAIADTKLATISSAGKVLNSATTATNLATASAIVARDASSNFSANTITAALLGNATTATTLQTARNINATSFNGSASM